MNGSRSILGLLSGGPQPSIRSRAARYCALCLALLLPGSFFVLSIVWLWHRRHALQAQAPFRACKFPVIFLCCTLLLSLNGCSLRHFAIDRLSDAIADSGTSFTADDDPELVRAAVPFSLKLMESLLAENRQHKGLLLAGAKGFTQYGYAFVQQEADEVEERDLVGALALRERARRLYSRARDYGLRGLAVGRPDFPHQLRTDSRRAVAAVEAGDVGLLYWTAASWAALVSLSKDSPAVLAEIPLVEALMDRALELDESFDKGAIHTFMISYEMVRQGQSGDAALRARAHFVRARELSSGNDLSPLVALAESVCVPMRERAEFESLLQQTLRFDTKLAPANRLSNLVMQKRARWLLAHVDQLFVE
jgi:predicted anti-sigma-YlaC factor YlaD